MYKTSRTVSWLFLVIVLLSTGCALKKADTGKDAAEKADLFILHTNDTHSYMAGLDASGAPCVDDAQCFGGYARIAYAIKKARQERNNVLVVDAGDRFQGTLFYKMHGWPMIADCAARIPYDAVTLGNHEWDAGCEELARYLDTLRDTKTVVAGNMMPGVRCPLVRSPHPPYVIREIGGQKVGIIGLANDEVLTVSKACPDTRFSGRAESVRRSVKELEAQGVRRIVAVTHIGLPADRELARTVDGIDVIVGGHTHSYLGPGSDEGPYPIVEKSPSGLPVLIVTAGKATRYLGELACSFDENGILTDWHGQARELQPGDLRDSEMSALVARYAKSIKPLREREIGRHSLDLGPDGLEACRNGQCVTGLLMADAMLEFGRKYGASLAFINGGGIRAPLPRGSVTMADILTAFPFEDKIVIHDYTGEEVRAALEHGIAGERGCGPELLQPSGLRYVFNSKKPAGHRLTSVELVDEKGRISPLLPKKLYRVVLTSYMANSGSDFAMLPKPKVGPCKTVIDAEVIDTYLRKHKPARVQGEQRIIRE